MNKIRLFFTFLLCVSLSSVLTIYAQEDPNCPGAPLPRLTVGAQARVLPGDANNVRDLPSRAGALVGSIPGGEAFSVLDGPACADGFNWWQVEYGDLFGWTVEGSGTEYWIEPYEAAAEPTEAPAVEPTNTPLPEPVPDFEPPVEALNVLEVGVQARVINDDPDSDTITLTVRAEPGRSGAPLAQAQEGDLLTLIGGPQEAAGLRWWQVETAGGTEGWVIEGLVNTERDNAYERTLLPLCPADGERIAYRVGDYIVTSALDGSDACVLDYTNALAWMTFSDRTFRFDNIFLPSPNGEYFLYSDPGLYRMKYDGSERLALTRDFSIDWAAWSPDGQRIAVATGSSIVTLRADGTGAAAVTRDPGNYSWVGWQSDSETLVFLEQDRWGDQIGTAIEFSFHRINIREGGLREIFDAPEGFDLFSASISPDGTRFAVSGVQYGLIDGMRGNEPIQLYDIEHPVRSITQVIDLETESVILDSDVRFYGLSWLPDGSALVSTDFYEGALDVLPVNGDASSELEFSGDVLPSEYLAILGWESDTVLLTYRGFGFQVEPSDYGIWAVDVTTGNVERRWSITQAE